MTNKEQEFIEEVMILFNKVPQASPNPYDMTGWIHAARDYEKVHHLTYSIITNYVAYKTWKDKKDVEEEWLDYMKEQYEESFLELKEFITQRVSEGWI